MAIPSASEVRARYVAAAGAAQQRYVDGVLGTSKDPTQLAIAAQPKMLSNFNQAIQSGRFQRNLAKVGKAGWQAATQAKAGNYSTGINAAGDKYEAAIGPVLQIEAQLQQQIAGMPNATFQDSINRMVAFSTGLHNWALSR